MRILTNQAFLGPLTVSLLLSACSVEGPTKPTPKGSGGSTSYQPNDEEPDDAEVLEITAVLPVATVNTPYSATLRAKKSISKVRFELASGSLPPGLTLSEEGELSGSPLELGDFAFEVAAENFQEVKGTASFTISVTRKRWVVYEAQATDSAGAKVFAVDITTPGFTQYELRPATAGYDALSLASPEATWSDDGRMLAFLGSNSGDTALFVVDMSGDEPGDVRTVAEGTTLSVYGWAPDSTRLAYALESSRSIYTVDAGEPGDAPQNHGTGDSAFWATTEFLVYENQDVGIFSVRFDEAGHGETRATGFLDDYVASKSLGSQLLVTRVVGSELRGSTLFDLETRSSLPVYVSSADDFVDPSPDLRFALHGSREDGWGLVKLLDAMTNGVRAERVSKVVAGNGGSWSPDSRWVVLDGPTGYIARLDATTSSDEWTSFHPIGGEDGSLVSPGFSPDSRWLQFRTVLSGSIDDYTPGWFYVVDLDSESLEPSALLQEPWNTPTFSPNSRYLAVARLREEDVEMELSLIDLAGDLEPQLVPLADANAGNRINDITFTADSLALIYAVSASGAFLVNTAEIGDDARPQRLTRLEVKAASPQR